MTEMNFRKLQGRIKEVCGTQEKFADALGISTVSLYKKLNNMSPWKQDEILNACKILQIDPRNIYVYFFTQSVKKT